MDAAFNDFLTAALRTRKSLALTALLAAAAPVCAAPASVGLSLSPSAVRQGMRYAGADILVTASVPSAEAYLLRLLGPSKKLHLMRKGRVWGVWMSVGEENFEEVPSLCLTASSAGWAPDDPEEKALGCPALAAAGSGAKEAELIDQMIELQRSQGLFAGAPGTVSVSQDGPTRSRLRAVIRLPAKAPPAVYEVELFAKTGAGLQTVGRASLEVRKEGLPAALEELLALHPLLYGILAVLIACAAGLTIGFIFGKVEH